MAGSQISLSVVAKSSQRPQSRTRLGGASVQFPVFRLQVAGNPRSEVWAEVLVEAVVEVLVAALVEALAESTAKNLEETLVEGLPDGERGGSRLSL